jgi:hypothetical protein
LELNQVLLQQAGPSLSAAALPTGAHLKTRKFFDKGD